VVHQTAFVQFKTAHHCFQFQAHKAIPYLRTPFLYMHFNTALPFFMDIITKNIHPEIHSLYTLLSSVSFNSVPCYQHQVVSHTNFYRSSRVNCMTVITAHGATEDADILPPHSRPKENKTFLYMREKSHAYLLRNLRASIKSGTHSREFQ
jgi:hypothetical protein